MKKGDRVTIDVAQIEFVEGGNTLWVHGPSGGTVLRLKVTGAITSERCESSPVPHGDAMIPGDLSICIPKPGDR
jgi:hypothetical protein